MNFRFFLDELFWLVMALVLVLVLVLAYSIFRVIRDRSKCAGMPGAVIRSTGAVATGGVRGLLAATQGRRA